MGTIAPRSSKVLTLHIMAGLLPERLRAAVAVHGYLRDAPPRGSASTLALALENVVPVPRVTAGASALALINAEIASPLACLSPLGLPLGAVFVGVPVTRMITVQNLCALSIEWKVDPYVGFVAPAHDVRVALDLALVARDERMASENKKTAAAAAAAAAAGDLSPGARSRSRPRSRPTSPHSHRPKRAAAQVASFHVATSVAPHGTLGPLESVQIELTITPLATGRVESFIAVDITGAPLPLALAFSATVRDVTLAFAVVDDATGVVAPFEPGAAAADAAFAAELNEMGSCLGDPTAVAVASAFARARAAGASLGMIPAMSFSGDRPWAAWKPAMAALRPNSAQLHPRGEPLPLHSRVAQTLLVFNLSGIPTALDVLVDDLAAPGRDVDWPALYAVAAAVAGNTVGGGADAAAATRLPFEVDDYKGPPRGPLRVALMGKFGVLANSDTGRGGSVTAAPRGGSASTAPPLPRGSGGGSLRYSPNIPSTTPRLSDAHEAIFRFTSPGGRALVAGQETASVRQRALGRNVGAAVDVFPSRIDLPAFGCAAFAIGAVADVPGFYADVLRVRSSADKGEYVSRLTFGVTGNPLSFQPGPAGLRCKNAGSNLDPMPLSCAGYITGPPPRGVRSAELNFGDMAEGAHKVSVALQISNSSCLDAWLTWHLMHDRAPSAAPDAVALNFSVLDAHAHNGGSPDGGGGGWDGIEADGGDFAGHGRSPGHRPILAGLAGYNDDDGRHNFHHPDPNAHTPPSNIEFEPLDAFLASGLDCDSVELLAAQQMVTATGLGDSVDSFEGSASQHRSTPTRAASVSSLFAVELRPHTDRVMHRDVPLAFALSTETVRVPAHGRATINVSFSVRIPGERDAKVARSLGWAAEAAASAGGGGEDEPMVKIAVAAALRLLRARFVADAIFAAPGVAVSDELTALAHRPQSPGKAGAALEWGGKRGGPPAPTLVRDALTLHAAARPFAPHLLVDCGVAGADGDVIVKWSLSSKAAASAREASLIATATATAGSAVAAARARSSGRGPNRQAVAATSSALVSGALASSASPSLPPSAVHTITLTNPAVSALAVTLEVSGPFVLLAAAAAVPLAPLAALLPTPQGGRSLVLPGSSSIAVTVAYDASAATGIASKTTALGATATAASAPDSLAFAAVALARLRGDFFGALTLGFRGGSTQRVVLHAVVARPAVAVSPAVLNLGLARAAKAGPKDSLVGSDSGGVALGTLRLSNPTAVPAEWAIRHVPAPAASVAAASAGRAAATAHGGYMPSVQMLSAAGAGAAAGTLRWSALGLPPTAPWANRAETVPPIDDPTVFSFSLVSGELTGPTIPLDAAEAGALRHSEGLPSPLAIDVRFAPRSQGLFSSRFKFTVAHGESFEVVLSGIGTYEEVYPNPRSAI